MNTAKRLPVAILLTALAFATQAFSAEEKVTLTGAGATFPYPIYSKWFSEYEKKDPEVRINYTSIGSGGGIRQLLDGTVDFGASDAPMTEEQMKKARSPILHIPTVLGAVAVTYNLPEVKKPLRMSSEVLANIFLGTITKWNDPAIAKLNEGVALPKTAIFVAHRSDGSGTTAIFSDYLSKVSTEWKSRVGSGTALKWPTGLGGKGNEGVTGLVKQTPGAIGYVELIYAKSNGLPVAELRNAAGNFVEPSAESVTAAASGALKDMPADFRVSITNPKGKDAYPISAFTYLLVPQQFKSAKGREMVEFLNWAVTEGQEFAAPLHYAALPKSLVSKVKKQIGKVETR